jgi:hypothetical protein
VGRDGLRRARVSEFWSIETKREEIEATAALYRVSEACWRSATAAATAGRGASIAVSSSCASGGGDEDEDVRLVFIRAKRYGLVLGYGLEMGLGLLLGFPGFSLSSFLFSIFCFLFSI